MSKENIIAPRLKHPLEFLMKSENLSVAVFKPCVKMLGTQHIHFSIALLDLPQG